MFPVFQIVRFWKPVRILPHRIFVASAGCHRSFRARSDETSAPLTACKTMHDDRDGKKSLYPQMIMEEANKVVTWERTADIARREALQYAADVHGHSRAAAAAAALERGALVEAMMSQKATIMLLSTVSTPVQPPCHESLFITGCRTGEVSAT